MGIGPRNQTQNQNRMVFKPRFGIGDRWSMTMTRSWRDQEGGIPNPMYGVRSTACTPKGNMQLDDRLTIGGSECLNAPFGEMVAGYF